MSYADDSALSLGEEVIIYKTNQLLKLLYHLMYQNKLELNIRKIKYISFVNQLQLIPHDRHIFEQSIS